jgi:hypothetical protein
VQKLNLCPRLGDWVFAEFVSPIVFLPLCSMQAIFLSFLLALCAASAALAGERSNCPVSKCDLLADGAYSNVLIGTLDTVLSDEQSHQLLRAMQSQGRWAEVPADGQQFTQSIVAVVMQVPHGNGTLRVIALMSKDESQVIALQPGDLVRFRPHHNLTASNTRRPSGGAELAYWKTIGCLDPLCRADDPNCQARYRRGAWRVADGQSIDPFSALPMANGPRIDPVTYLPERTGGAP